MWQIADSELAEQVYLAGECAPPGHYRQVEGTREVKLDSEGILPASLDGRVACYVRIGPTWAHFTSRSEALPQAIAA